MMDLTISSHDTRRERVAYYIYAFYAFYALGSGVVAAMLIPLDFGFLSQDLVVPPHCPIG